MRNFNIFFGLFLTIVSQSLLALEVGVSKVDITPYEFERMKKGQRGYPNYIKGNKWIDSGTDRLFDVDEPGAFGVDGKPGVAGFDDDQDGIIDNTSEYLAQYSDDIKDPNGDNYHWKYNREGTEGNGKFDLIALGGFNPFYNIPFAKARVVDGVHDPIWSRAIAVRENGQTIVMISVDLPGLNMKHINPAKRKIAEAFGVPIANIVIAATHNHGAPDGSGYWTTRIKRKNKKYTDQLRKWLVQSAQIAIQNMRAAKMKTIVTDHIACYNPETKKWLRAYECDFQDKSLKRAIQRDARKPEVLNHEITASQFVDLETNSTIATFVNWHNHPESAKSDNMLITSDFPGYLRDYLETKLGGTSVYFSGTVGCQIGNAHYVPRWSENMTPVYSGLDSEGNPTRAQVREGDKWEKVRSIGYEIGNEVYQSLSKSDEYYTSAPLEVDAQNLDIAPINFLHLLATRSMWKFDIEKPDRLKYYWPRCLPPRGCVRLAVQKIKIGELSMMTAPGEIDPAYWFGREASTYRWSKKHTYHFEAMEGAKELLPTKYKAVLGLANGYLSYMVHRKDNLGALRFDRPDHYEEFVTVNKHFGDDLGNLWMWMLGSEYRYSKRRIYPRPR
jgi:hypothetical protein